MKSYIISSILILMGCLLIINVLSCNSDRSTESTTETAAPATTETVATSTDVSPASTDAVPVTTNRVDTAENGHTIDSLVPMLPPDSLKNNNKPENRKSATLGYSYPPVMRRKEVRNINVYVLIRNQQSRIKDTLKAFAAEQSDTNDDSVSINITNVIWYKTLSITLVDPAGDFTIVPVHHSEKQVIDTVDGNHWRWTIQTTTDKKITQMILKIVAEKEDGTIDHFDDRTIHIAIRIDRDIFRRFTYYLSDNPAVSIPILVSLFGFLGWYIKRRYDKNKA
jgi:hypothetical protein